MRQMSVAVGTLACVLVACADPTSTQLTPTGPRNVSNQLKPALTGVVVSSPGNCITKVEWDGSGVALVEHLVELDIGTSLGVRVGPDKPPKTSTAQWNPGSFHGNTNRVPTGRVQATLYDKKNNVLANTGWVSVGFDCI